MVDLCQITELFWLWVLELPSPHALLSGLLLIQWLWGTLQRRSASPCSRAESGLPLVFVSPGIKSGCYILNGWEKTKRRIIFSNMSKLYKVQISVLTTTFFLAHSHIPSFTYCLWLLSCWDSNADECLQWLLEPKLLTTWHCTGKVCQPLPECPDVLSQNLGISDMKSLETIVKIQISGSQCHTLTK